MRYQPLITLLFPSYMVNHFILASVMIFLFSLGFSSLTVMYVGVDLFRFNLLGIH